MADPPARLRVRRRMASTRRICLWQPMSSAILLPAPPPAPALPVPWLSHRPRLLGCGATVSPQRQATYAPSHRLSAGSPLRAERRRGLGPWRSFRTLHLARQRKRQRGNVVWRFFLEHILPVMPAVERELERMVLVFKRLLFLAPPVFKMELVPRLVLITPSLPP